jgi:Xaa-Pro aminopeptidase
MNDPLPADDDADVDLFAETKLLGLDEPGAAPAPPGPEPEPLPLAEPETAPEPSPALEPLPLAEAPLSTQPSALSTPRRAEIDAKQERVAALLAEAGADALLLLESANIAWLTGAPLCQGLPDSVEWPALWLTNNQRWLVAGNTDAQRLFDAHLDGLGFQLKEWPWHWGRDRMLGDLCQNRRVAGDRLLADSVPVGPTLRRLRCTLTAPEQARLRELGTVVAHALEATCRSLEPGQSEAEVAGHLAHRLLRHGAQPVALTAAADGRAGRHRRPGITEATIQRSCLVAATATRDGLHVTAARTVWFGPADPVFRQEFDVACRVVAAQAATGAPGAAATTPVEAGLRVAHMGGHDETWRLSPPGYVTGWLPVERPLSPGLTFEADWAVVWQVGIGAAQCADTFLVAAPPVCVTPPEAWPVKRIRVQGLAFDVPDLLVR